MSGNVAVTGLTMCINDRGGIIDLLTPTGFVNSGRQAGPNFDGRVWQQQPW